MNGSLVVRRYFFSFLLFTIIIFNLTVHFPVAHIQSCLLQSTFISYFFFNTPWPLLASFHGRKKEQKNNHNVEDDSVIYNVWTMWGENPRKVFHFSGLCQLCSWCWEKESQQETVSGEDVWAFCYHFVFIHLIFLFRKYLVYKVIELFNCAILLLI